jgi:hypothetical protein
MSQSKPQLPQPQSLTRKGMVRIVGELRKLAIQKGHAGGKLTSHDLCAIFTNSPFVRDTREKYGGDLGYIFHPKEKFAEFYSMARPTVIITYTWAGLCLETDLPKFLDMFEAMFGADPNLTFWLDIFFNDQNNPAGIGEALKIADGLYRSVRFHLVLICNGTLSRGWCNSEISTRLIHMMETLGRSEEQVAEMVWTGDARCPIPLIVPGLTDIVEDLWAGSSDRFEGMETFDPQDKTAIQSNIIAGLKRKEAFNYVMTLYCSAALRDHARRNPVQGARRVVGCE